MVSMQLQCQDSFQTLDHIIMPRAGDMVHSVKHVLQVTLTAVYIVKQYLPDIRDLYLNVILKNTGIL